MLNKRILVLMFVVAFTFVGCLPTPTPPNEVPIITSTPVTAATVGVLYTYDVNATDPDGDTLAYSLAVKPSGMTINSATGLIKWTPTTKGDYPVTVKVSDGTLSINQNFTIKVKVVNHAPIITSIPITTATVGVTYFYGVNATDPDNDVLTYSLTAYPNGMTINPATGLIWWIPATVQVGNNSVTVMVSDGVLIDIQGFTITVSAVEPDPEIGLVGITVEPKEMTLFVGGEPEAIKSVTAIYEIKGFEVPIPLGDCTYDLVNETVITVSNVGLVKAVGEGTATITVTYKGKTDKITVTVSEPVFKTITVRWLEGAVAFNPNGSDAGSWKNDPIPPGEPATLIQDNGGYHFADAYEYYNFLITPEAELKGSVVISGTGELTGYVTYLYTRKDFEKELLTEDILVGQVEIIIYEEGDTYFGGDHDGTMVGTYTQWSYKFGTEQEVLVEGGYPLAKRCEGFADKWLVRYADYIAHGEEPTP